MLLSVLSSGGEPLEIVLLVLISFISLFPALTFHEWAHGYAAYKLGDSTAKADGRLSLNPLDHMDFTGTLMMLLVGFGWAKPVPVNTRYFKKPRRDFAITSLAGPLANFVAAFVFALFYVVSFYVFYDNDGMTAFAIQMVFYASMSMNLGLGLFNLIPIPPLDGSNILMCFLPNRIAAKYSKIRYYTHYIILGIILISYLPYPLNLISDYIFLPLSFARDGLMTLFLNFWDNILLPIFISFL